MFTDIDRSASLGITVNGERWARSNDIFGIAFGLADIGVAHRDYFNAGGLGVLIGDGKLPISATKISLRPFTISRFTKT